MGLVANKKQMLVMIICVFLVLSVNKIAAQDLCYGRCYKFCREGYNYNILRCGIRCIDACLAYSVELKKANAPLPAKAATNAEIARILDHLRGNAPTPSPAAK